MCISPPNSIVALYSFGRAIDRVEHVSLMQEHYAPSGAIGTRSSTGVHDVMYGFSVLQKGEIDVNTFILLCSSDVPVTSLHW